MTAQPWLFPELDYLCQCFQGLCIVKRKRGRPLGGACSRLWPVDLEEKTYNCKCAPC